MRHTPRRPAPRTSLLAALLAGASLVGSLLAATGPARAAPTLEAVASFEHQVTGVTVAADGRIFVNFPRWTEDAPVSVAELMRDGSIKPYPDEGWNSWRNARKGEVSAGDHFVCVQSVVADGTWLWVLDPAAPAMGTTVKGGPKLVGIDLATNTVARTIAFDETVAPQGSYLNDVRFAPDGKWAYITDSGARGAIVVVDFASGKAERVLDGHPSTQVDESVKVKTDGAVLRRPDGRGVEFSADGLALSPDGRTLYWQAIQGKTLYSVPTSALTGLRATLGATAGAVETVGENGPADGLLIAKKSGRMYVTAPEENAVKVRDLSVKGGTPAIAVQDPRLRWPDTMSEAPDGTIYVTSSHIQDSAFFKPDAPASLPTQLWRFAPAP